MARIGTPACVRVGLVAGLVGCSFSPNLGNGTVACGPNGLCPDGFSCQSDNRCYKSGGPAECIPSCVAGLECQNGSCVCTSSSCPEGCCAGSTCVLATTANDCGQGGGVCRACGVGSDGCVADGGCSCGGTAPCQGGARCVDGLCECDSSSCPGCCQGGNCLQRGTSACGVNGATCVSCDSDLADWCSP